MKLISNQINPHFTLLDSLHAVYSLVFGASTKTLDKQLTEEFGTENILFTNTARSALGLIGDTIKPDPSKKIGIPAFVCAVVATPFLARGYQIEWLETDEQGLIDVEDFAQKAGGISLVVVPHIFGQVAPLNEIITVARQHDIFVVEDSAHYIKQLAGWSFSTKTTDQADAQILSFGREKVISCVSGGALIWPEKSPYKNEFSSLKTTLPRPTLGWVIRHAFQPLIFSLSLPWWHRGGKLLPWIARSLKILPLAVTPKEKHGQEDITITRLSVVQKRLLARQLKQWSQRQVHAQAIAPYWEKQLKPQFPKAQFIIPPLAFRTLITFSNPSEKQHFCRQLSTANRQFHLDDWTGVPISPQGIDYKRFGYRPGQCPKAEYFARTYLTFPTNIRVGKADIKRFAQKPTAL